MEEEDLANTGECGAVRDDLEKWYDASTIPAGATEALVTADPPIGNRVDATFGGFAQLVGLDVTPKAKAGERVELAWTFHALDKVRSPWKLFVHAEGPVKGTFFNGDHDPVRPFEWWKAGDIIHYTTTITLPRSAAAGKYTVWVGLFHGADRAHVEPSGKPVEADAVAAATFEVVR